MAGPVFTSTEPLLPPGAAEQLPPELSLRLEELGVSGAESATAAAGGEAPPVVGGWAGWRNWSPALNGDMLAVDEEEEGGGGGTA